MLNEDEIDESLRAHRARNSELLRVIQAKGVDLKKAFTVDHHFWAPNRQSATALGAELSARGYVVSAMNPVQTDARSTIWNVAVQMERSLAEAGDENTTEELVILAARFDSIYDGWGAAID